MRNSHTYTYTFKLGSESTRFYHILSLIFLFTILHTPVQAQRSSIQGIVTDRNTGEPLQGANIVLQKMEQEPIIGVAAGRGGFYRIGDVEPGSWLLRFSFIGYIAKTDTIYVEEGVVNTINASLSTNDASLGELVVSSASGAARREEGAQRITAADFRRVPGPSSGDLTTYIQTLPGVVSMGDRGGQLFIRGGTPSENMVLVDGAIMYQPSHIVGYYSPLPENIVSGADFYAGGFGPRYSGRISSVLDVQLRHGSLYNFSGSLTVNPFASEVFAEGPFKNGSSSWIFSARNSHIDQASSWYPIEEQPLNFESQFLKTSYIADETRCSAMMMHTYDKGRMDFESDENIRWRNFLIGGRCTLLPDGLGTLVNTNINLSTFSNSVGDSGPFGFSSNILRLSMDIDLRQYAGNTRFDYGFYTRFKNLNFDLGEKFAGFNSGSSTHFIIGGHLESTLPVGENFNLQPGLALSYNGIFGIAAEPRFRFNWNPFGRESEEISGAAGLYLQPITGVSDIRDVSSVFIAWMSAPINESQKEAFHALLGWQQSITDEFSWSLEGYFKRMQNQAIPVWNTIAEFTTELAIADGETFGGDIRFEYNKGRFYGLLGYGYSWTLYNSAQDHFNIWFGEPVQEFHPPHDRRHQINSLASLDIGSYTAAFRWQMGSGMPFTQPLGFDDILDFRDRLPDVNRDRGVRRIIIDKPYRGRMPTTHRLDISVERSFELTSWSSMNLQAGAINTYNKTNIFYYDVFTNRRIDQLSFAPYLTLKMEVK